MGKAAESPRLTHSPSSSSTSSFSSQDFEFTVSLSPASRRSSSQLCPADELFFKGQLLPLHLPPRLQIIHSLIAPPPPPEDAPPSSFRSSVATTTCSLSPLSTITTTHRPPLPPPHPMITVDSTGWSSDTTSSRDSFNSSSCDSSRRTSSATTDDDDTAHLTTTSLKKLRHHFPRLPLKKHPPLPPKNVPPPLPLPSQKATAEVYPQTQIAERNNTQPPPPASKTKLLSSLFITKSKKMSKSAKQVFQKYINKVKPLYEKISHQPATSKGGDERGFVKERDSCSSTISNSSTGSASFHHPHSHSFSGNLRFPKRRDHGPRYIGSCPSSMRSSPSHSGVLAYGDFSSSSASSSSAVDPSSMEELQSAIQGAIAHCKKSIAAPEDRANCDSVVTM